MHVHQHFAMASTTDSAMQNRITSHMTADHATSLSLYLQHYSRIPASQLPDPPAGKLALDEVTLEHMIISHPGGRNLVPFDPPLTSYAQARERVVAMHKDCLAALDLSETKVEKFVWPNKLWQWGLHLLAFWCLISFGLLRADVRDASTVAGRVWSLGGLAPSFARFAAKIGLPVVVGMVAIHIGEATYFDMGRARRHGLRRGTKPWWSWTICVLNAGVAGLTRFDDYVEELNIDKANTKGQH